jgi:hypothetical protein
MTRAPDGSYYVTGYSWGGDYTGKGAPASVYAWLIKLDATGKKVWAEQWAGTGAPYGYTQEMGRSLALGPNGEIYVGGLVGSTLGGNATAYSCPEPIHDGTGTDCGDVVLSSWEDLGIQAKRNWRTVKPNKGYQTSASIAADTGGNIILVGGTYGDTKDDKSPGNEDTSLGLADPNRYKVGGGVWVFDSAGGVQSSDYVKIDAQDLGLNGVAYDNAGNAIIVGGTTGAFDGWTNQGGGDFFVMQRPGTGTGGWVKMFGSAGDDNAGPLYIGPSGDIYVGGTTTGLLYAAPSGNLDAFVTHLDPNGDQVLAGGQPLAVQFGGAGNDRPWEIGFDRYKNVFVCGTTDGKLGEGLTLSFGGRDIFVAKLGPGFNLQ